MLRVRDPSDHEAWGIFASIYRRAIFRAARCRGLQAADAEDITQEVLSRLSTRSWQFTPQSDGPRFRTWLARVTDNAITDHHRKQRRHLETLSVSHAVVTAGEVVHDCFEMEYRREVFQWAARIVRNEFSAAAWQSFWMTAVENRSVEEAAAALGRTVGSVYTSRSRILRRLKRQVRCFDETLEDVL